MPKKCVDAGHPGPRLAAVVLVAAWALGAAARAQDFPIEGTATDETSEAAVRLVDPRLLQATSLLQEERWPEAEAILSSLHDDRPEDPAVRKYLSMVKIQNLEQEEALRLMEPMLSNENADFVVLNNAAWLYATAADKGLRDSTKAVDLARQAMLLNPNNYHVWSTLAEAYYADGQFDQALKASKESLRLADAARVELADQTEIREQAAKIQKAVQALSLIE